MRDSLRMPADVVLNHLSSGVQVTQGFVSTASDYRNIFHLPIARQAPGIIPQTAY